MNQNLIRCTGCNAVLCEKQGDRYIFEFGGATINSAGDVEITCHNKYCRRITKLD